MLITIGNDAYDPCPEQGNWGALKGAVNDSRSIGDHCRKCGDWLVYSFENVTEAEFKSSAKQAGCRINQATSIVAFHYSGHAVESQGKTWLIPVIDNEDPDKQGKGNKVNPVILDTLLHTLCRNISRNAKLIVLIDGCRTEPDKEPSVEPPPIHWPRREKPDFLQFYACLSGSSAHEIDLGSGCWHGRFSMAVIKYMQKCENLDSLVEQVRSEVQNLDKIGSKQKPCITHTWSYSSTKNFFRKELHVPDMVKQMETIQKGVDELRVQQDLENQLQDRLKEVDKLKSQKCQLEEECRKLKRDLQNLEKNKDANEEKILRLRKDLTEKERELRDKEDELNEKTFELECLQKRLALKQERLKDAEDARTESEKREHAHLITLESLKQENTTLMELWAEVRKEVAHVGQSVSDAGQFAFKALDSWTSAEVQEGDVHQNHSLLEERAESQEQLTMQQQDCCIKEDGPHSWWDPRKWSISPE